MKSSLLLAVVATASAFAPVLPSERLLPGACSTSRTSRPAALLDLFGKKPKKEEGALATGLDALVKDAPLPVKLAVGLMKPLVGALESTMRESAADADDLLEEAGRRLRLDTRLGGAQLGRVFSTSSSSSSINGVTQKRINLQCELVGASGSLMGTAALQGATQPEGKVGLAALQVQLSDGRVLDVAGGGGGGGGGGGDAIDVEVIVD
uniref:Plastid lipid-associated protein/fibrillin conserved domain-containing protein n=1 Tax=Prymnesium polylepis TaxID=72548 RepID=A0A6T8BWP4_9EUKA|mmetsp:Transcript_40034/g.99590  ORF Transcript_40034/g.99590 Transcript_40034/m.99590 type:complete len:208 (+) Transcript_40034:1-624(+)